MNQKVFEGDHYWVVKEPRLNDQQIRSREIIPKDGRWSFNGDFEKPTFSPSIKHSSPKGDRCNHFIITGGSIFYCSDCTHDKAGKTLLLESFEEWEIEIMKGCY